MVSCPAYACLQAGNSLVNEVEFLGLIPQNGRTNENVKSIIGASLSEPHTSVTALQVACVCLFAAIYCKF